MACPPACRYPRSIYCFNFNYSNLDTVVPRIGDDNVSLFVHGYAVRPGEHAVLGALQ